MECPHIPIIPYHEFSKRIHDRAVTERILLGGNRELYDEPVPSENILGKVVEVKKWDSCLFKIYYSLETQANNKRSPL